MVRSFVLLNPVGNIIKHWSKLFLVTRCRMIPSFGTKWEEYHLHNDVYPTTCTISTVISLCVLCWNWDTNRLWVSEMGLSWHFMLVYHHYFGNRFSIISRLDGCAYCPAYTPKGRSTLCVVMNPLPCLFLLFFLLSRFMRFLHLFCYLHGSTLYM